MQPFDGEIAFHCARCNRPAQWEVCRIPFTNQVQFAVTCHGEREIISAAFALHRTVFRQNHVGLSQTDR